MKTNANTYKILVLSDLKKSTTNLLKSSISLAQIINGDIDFFHVKKPTEIVGQESQLSAIRTINKLHTATTNEIEQIITPISEAYNIPITYKHAFGNVKNEIGEYIKKTNPDIIVLGQRKSKPLSFIGDNISDFVIAQHDGVIMIAADDKTLEPNSELSLGALNGIEKSFNMDFAHSLIEHSQKPLKSFKIYKDSSASETQKEIFGKKTIEYAFDQGSNSMKSLSNYLSKSDVNLLCFNRATNGQDSLAKSEVKNAIDTLNVSLLITNGQNQSSI
ncbi:universal stress protein [uncultured Psychroserpens sp.]|uniref:universal stress protein n=1 Tax=uncultured Psychroserpens sp. TaxID=255436 RepID=UPI002633CD3B|nr:universal stress protein [uncultured Psychroserpens sp.]